MVTKTADVTEGLEAAADFANDPRMLAAFTAAARDDKIWNRAMQDPDGLLRQQGVALPPGLTLRFFDHSSPTKPAPDWDGQPYQFYTLEFTQCRKYWVKKRGGGGWEQVEVCRGFMLVPQPIPGGPIA